MQRPTCTMLRVRSPSDAHVLFHAVSLNLLPIVARRLDTEERRQISSGCVYIWEERGSNSESTGLGIERWTDSIRWGPSRVKDEFLFYHEKEPDPSDLEFIASESDVPINPHQFNRGFYRENLIKQTYSVFVDTPRGRRKWHLIAYFTQESLPYLHTVDDIPGLANLQVPPGKYKSARSAKNKAAANYDPLAFQPRYPPYRTPPYYPAALETNHYPAPSRRNSLAASQHSPPSPPSPLTPHSIESSTSRSHADRLTEMLAPLAYLENIPPRRRHPLDEEALMSFTGGLPV